MKNKKLTYVLLILVLAIWGSILHQLFLSENDVDFKEHEVVAIDVETIDKKDEIVSLNLNYRDPFLERKSKPKQKTVNISKLKNTTPKKTAQTQNIQWPLVEYSGSITNKSADNKMALIKINGKEHLLKEGDSKEGIQIGHIFNDSITLAYMNTAKTIYK